jgi:hypothetical protein
MGVNEVMRIVWKTMLMMLPPRKGLSGARRNEFM